MKKHCAKRPMFHEIPPAAGPEKYSGSLVFHGSTQEQFKIWRGKFLREFRQALGKMPRRVRPRPEIVERKQQDGCILEKVIYWVEDGLAGCAWLCRPATSYRHDVTRMRSGKTAAVLCIHGHGPGKDPLIGWWDGKPCPEYHKRISVRLAQKGFITFTPDRRGYGDCSRFVRGYPSDEELRQLDNFYRRRGASLLALDIHDGICALDALAEMKMVDIKRVGCVGLADGAAVAAGLGALDSRIKAMCLGCYLSDQRVFPGMMIWQWPGYLLTRQAGTAEVSALFAPRPLLVQAAEACPYVPSKQARRAFPALRRMYALAGAEGQCELLNFDGVLELDFNSAAEWMEKVKDK